jgi:hypothetical protein
MDPSRRRGLFKLFGAALLTATTLGVTAAEAQWAPPPPGWGRPPPPGWRRPPPLGYWGAPPRRWVCWWRPSPWGPQRVCGWR